MDGFGEIPALYLKFRLLIAHGVYKDWKTLGAEFGVSGKTVQAWGHGSAKQRVNWVPEHHQATLIKVFGKAFSSKNYGPTKIRNLILAPVYDLERELQLSRTYSLIDLIEQEGRSDACELLFPSSKLDLVSRRSARQRQPQLSVAMTKPFRLEFQTGFHGRKTYALQQVERLWAPIDSSFDASGRIIHVPGPDDSGKPDFMEEHENKGLHRFVVLQTKALLPLSAEAALRQSSILDSRTLDELAAFYSDIRKTERRIFYVDIEITAEQPSQMKN